MKDSPQRRNRVAAIVTQHYIDLAERAYKEHADAAGISAPNAVGTYLMVLAALAGETEPHKLGIDPLSMTAMRIVSITTDPTEGLA